MRKYDIDWEGLLIAGKIIHTAILIIFILFAYRLGSEYLAYSLSDESSKKRFFKSYKMREIEMYEKKLDILDRAVEKFQGDNFEQLITTLQHYLLPEKDKNDL